MKTNKNGAIAPQQLSGFNEKTKKWQMELMMERLRSKATQHKTFPELSKSMRMSMLEKRYALDSVEKTNLQKCLDSMQHCIKVTTRLGLVERLESLSRQLGLKFTEDSNGLLFISSDMFYLEIVLDSLGTVQDVKVHHECKIDQQSCQELVTCLVNGDFADFTTQLEGLSSIYQLNAESKIKSKAFIALQALETDLINLFMCVQTYYNDPYALLYKSSVGVVQKRRGGHPMKLTYFVPSYELLDMESKSLTTLSVELINAKNSLGMNVTVNLEASPAHKLQIQPVLVFQPGHASPTYTAMGPTNSTMLPATFILRLNKPMPMLMTLIQQIKQKTDFNFGDSNATATPILTLITQHSSNGQLKIATKGLFVSLPDQNHCYFMTENRNLQGIIVNSIPFTEPSHVAHIIQYLRQQAVFNTLVGSCIRTTNNKHDIENTTMFELSALSCQHISIALEHPFDESMATVEFNLTDCANIMCKIFSNNSTNDEIISIKLSKIIQKSMSIPITLRALIKFWEQENIRKIQHSLKNGNFSLPLGPSDTGGRESGGGTGGGGGGGGGVGNGGGSVAGNGSGGNNSNTSTDYRDIKPKIERNNVNGFNNGGNNNSTSPINVGGSGVGPSGAGNLTPTSINNSGSTNTTSSANNSTASGGNITTNRPLFTAAGASGASGGGGGAGGAGVFSEQNLFHSIVGSGAGGGNGGGNIVSSGLAQDMGNSITQQQQQQQQQPTTSTVTGGTMSITGGNGTGGTGDGISYNNDGKITKRRRTEDFWKNPKSDLTNADNIMLEQSNNSSDSNSLGTPTSSVMSETGVATPNSNNTSGTGTCSSSAGVGGGGGGNSNSNSNSNSGSMGFQLIEHESLGSGGGGLHSAGISGIDAFDWPDHADNSNSSMDSNSMRKKFKKSSIDGSVTTPTPMSTTTTVSDLNEELNNFQSICGGQKMDDCKNSTKNRLAPSVSITPITENSPPSGINSVLTGLERRLGIEIIPISTTPPPNIKSSITITPINSSSAGSSSLSKSSSGGGGNNGSGSDKKQPSSSISGGNNTSSSSSSSSSGSNNSKRSSEDRNKIDKKKKRKREDHPMGPPNKMPLKTIDPLSRPVNATSINKTNDGNEPLSPSGLIRKFSNSPIHGKSSSSSSGGSGTGKPSPKRHSSPSHSNSPKHPSLPSPKSHSSSPKHSTNSSSSGSGKPSMSALKSAANSPSSKGEKSLKSSSSSSSNRDGFRERSGGGDRDRDRDREKDRDRDRDRDKDRLSISLKYSSGSNSPKLTKSTVKLKQIDLSSAMISSADVFMDGSSSCSQDSNKSGCGSGGGGGGGGSGPNQLAKNRKGSLSAVIDKLKSAQHVTGEESSSSSSSGGGGGGGGTKSNQNNSPPSSKERNNTTMNSSNVTLMNSGSSNSGALNNSVGGLLKNNEYMVKPSSDGMKITINKTRTKDSSSPLHGSSSSSSFSSSSSSLSSSTMRQLSGAGGGSNSQKTHTGLKPGVNSGPASKKPQNLSGLSSQNNNKLTNSTNSTGLSGPLSSLSSSSSPSFSSSSTKPIFQRSSSSGNLGSGSSTGSSSSSNSLASKSSSFSIKSFGGSSSSDSSMFNKKEKSRSSSAMSSSSSLSSSSQSSTATTTTTTSKGDRQQNMRIDHVDVLKMFSLTAQSQHQTSDGFKKTFDSKFQIPKLSARSNSTTALTTTTTIVTTTSTVSTVATTSPAAIFSPQTIITQSNSLGSTMAVTLNEVSNSGGVGGGGNGSGGDASAGNNKRDGIGIVVTTGTSSTMTATAATFHSGGGSSTTVTPTTLSGTAVCADDATKMLNDFFAISNLAKLASGNAVGGGSGSGGGGGGGTVSGNIGDGSNANSKYSVSDIHFNKNLQMYKSLTTSSDSIKELRDKQQNSALNHSSTTIISKQIPPAPPPPPPPLSLSQKQPSFPSPLLFNHHSINSTDKSQSVSPKINNYHSGSINQQSMRPPSVPPPPPPPLPPPLKLLTAALQQPPAVLSSSIASTTTQSLSSVAYQQPNVTKELTMAQQSSANTIINHQLSTTSPQLTSPAIAATITSLPHNKPIMNEQQQPPPPPSLQRTNINSQSMIPSIRKNQSPSVQLHIVKSPVPSPLVVIPSPISNSSPCITDDELIDETLVGISSK